jgi:starch synthase
MKILSVASEIHPLVKTGGLADVAGALPGAMAGLGISMRTLVPGYPAVMAAIGKARPVATYAKLFGGKVRVLEADAAGLDLLVLDAAHLFDRPGGPYSDASGQDWPDNWKRFAALARVGADIATGSLKDWKPDLVQVHDWQAGLLPAYLAFGEKPAPPSIMTVHNLAFQGRFGAEIFAELGLPAAAMTVDGIEYYGGIGFLKAGLQSASAIVTVSPGYAREIRRPEFGMGLDGLLNLRAGDMHGILNGIDPDVWDPQTDAALKATYGVRSIAKRARNRAAIEKRFELDADETPLVTVVSRLTWQKGLDLLAERLDQLVAEGVRLALLGSGDQALEGAFLAGASRHRGRVGVVIGYDEGLSHLLQGGADAILIPSRFEPCGLTQLYGLRYGCVPLASRTGGLADTIIDANDAALAAQAATGLLFEPGSADAMMDALRRMKALHADKAVWTGIQKAGMASDLSWHKRAMQYAELYARLLKD